MKMFDRAEFWANCFSDMLWEEYPKDTTVEEDVERCATNADRMLAEYDKRFPQVELEKRPKGATPGPCDIPNQASFLYWVRCRLVHHYGEDARTDWVIRLDDLIEKLAKMGH